jgi:hypothetical protein
MIGDREQMDESIPGLVQSGMPVVFVAITRAGLEDHPTSSDGGHAVTDGAARAVVGWPQAIFRRLDFGEVFQSQSKL